MRKMFVIGLTVLMLSFGSAFAQSGQWIGGSTGFPLGITLHYGIEDLLAPDLDLRINLNAVTFNLSTFSVTGGVDALYNLNLETEGDLPLDVYVGGGLNVGVSLGASTGIGLGARGLAGVEYGLTDQFSLFGELQVGLGIPLLQPGLVVGLNYRF